MTAPTSNWTEKPTLQFGTNVAVSVSAYLRHAQSASHGISQNASANVSSKAVQLGRFLTLLSANAPSARLKFAHRALNFSNNHAAVNVWEANVHTDNTSTRMTVHASAYLRSAVPDSTSIPNYATVYAMFLLRAALPMNIGWLLNADVIVIQTQSYVKKTFTLTLNHALASVHPNHVLRNWSGTVQSAAASVALKSVRINSIGTQTLANAFALQYFAVLEISGINRNAVASVYKKSAQTTIKIADFLTKTSAHADATLR